MVYELQQIGDPFKAIPQKISETVWKNLSTNKISATFYSPYFYSMFYFGEHEYYKLESSSNKVHIHSI